ncbi:MAG: ABC transporter ATP-binding protein [Rhodocyclales bacterium]|nr:ABC transporter ATP-binding protein [Rhodocyclales bacterium]
MNDMLIKAEGVSKRFCRSLKKSLWYGTQDLCSEIAGRRHGGHGQLREDEFWALQDVGFELRRGECLGLIGRNGAGKTTLLRLLNGLIRPDRGRIEIRGRVGALIALGAGFNPILTGRENIHVNASVLGLSRHEIDRKLDGIIDFSEIGDFIDTPVQNYSSGMQLRLGFAVASALEPDVLLLDEVLAVGDAGFRTKCFKRIGEVLQNAAVIFVSHSEAQVSRICDSTLLLESGVAKHHGSTSDGLRLYRESQQGPAPPPRIVADASVSALELHHVPESMPWGGMLEIELAVKISRPIMLGLIFVHFSRDGEYQANAEVRLESGGAMQLGDGNHILTFSVGPVHLGRGRYQVSVSIFDASGKTTIFQALDIASVDVVGPATGGVPHLVPIAFQVRQDVASPVRTRLTLDT